MHSAAVHQCFLLQVFISVLVFSGWNQCGTNENTFYWGCPKGTAACCSHTTLSLIVNITCTQLPLPSHWSRSPDSCPCSPPAPGHNRKSPYKCSHTSHLKILLTPSGRGILQDRHRWLLISSCTFLKTLFFKWSRFERQISSNLIILIVSYALNCFSVVALFLLHTFRSVSGRYKQKLQPYIPSTWGAMHCSALSPI